MDEALKKGAEGRKHSISLANLEYSGDLSSQMMQFSQKLETIYKKIQGLRNRKVEDPKEYANYFAILEDKLAWYEKAEAIVMIKTMSCSSQLSTWSSQDTCFLKNICRLIQSVPIIKK